MWKGGKIDKEQKAEVVKGWGGGIEVTSANLRPPNRSVSRLILWKWIAVVAEGRGRGSF